MGLQGLNISVTVYRRHQEGDDDVGGSVQTYSPIATRVPARISSTRSPMQLRAQGIEAINVYDCVIQPSGTSQFEILLDDVIVAEKGQYQNQQFVVSAIQEDSLLDNSNDFRRHRFLSLRRTEIARRLQ